MKKIKIKKDDLERISKVLEMSCEKDFECSKTGLSNCCLASIREHGLALEIIEKNSPKECEFLRQNGFRFFCDCPIHFYIRNNQRSFQSTIKNRAKF